MFKELNKDFIVVMHFSRFFSYVNDNKEVTCNNVQTMYCIICYNNHVNAFNPILT
jgi:hypothetical protein